MVRAGELRLASGTPYFDGLVLPDALVSVLAKKRGEIAQRREQKLRGQFKAFVKGLDKFECLPAPSNGDCLHCMMTVASGTDKGKSLGDATGDKSHLLEHVKEGYVARITDHERIEVCRVS